MWVGERVCPAHTAPGVCAESRTTAEGIMLCFQARHITANSTQSLTTARQPQRTLPALGTAQPVSVETHQNEFDQESSRTLPYSVH